MAMKKGMQPFAVPASMRGLDYRLAFIHRLGGRSEEDYS
jgi:hypothetical protein